MKSKKDMDNILRLKSFGGAVLVWVILGILLGLTVQAPLSKHLVFIIKVILGGIGYRLIERYAVYRYHYLQTKKKG